MITRILLACGALAFATLTAFAAEKSAAADVTTELKELVAKTIAKIQQGAATEAALADELKAFDALLAAHRSEKTDAVAQVLFTKATLYLQILEDVDRASEALNQVKAEFPNTRPAAEADQLLTRLEAHRESLKLQSALKPGAVFPDFEVKDVNGAPLSIAKFKGKAVLIDFWATWCGPCVAELPHVKAAYDKYREKGFEIVGISLDRDEATLKRFVADKKMTWPQYFDGRSDGPNLAEKYGVTSIPATYLLDRDGKIVAKNLRGPALEQELARLLAQ